MAYVTAVSVTSTSSGSLDEIFSKTNDSLGPLEWTMIFTEEIHIRYTGMFPEAGIDVTYPAGTYTVGTPTRGITKIEGWVTSTACAVTLLPSIG